MSNLEIASCKICNEHYSSTRPRVNLPCLVHSLCKICLCQLELKGDMRCPTCQVAWDEPLLDQAYAAVVEIAFGNRNFDESLKETGKSTQKQVLCTKHHYDMENWCESCSELLCHKCVEIDHRNHNSYYFSDSLNKIKATLGKDIEQTSLEIVRNITSIKSLKQNIDDDTLLVTFLERVSKAKYVLSKEKETLDQLECKALSINTRLKAAQKLMETFDQDATPVSIKECLDLVNQVKMGNFKFDSRREVLVKFASLFMVSELFG